MTHSLSPRSSPARSGQGSATRLRPADGQTSLLEKTATWVGRTAGTGTQEWKWGAQPGHQWAEGSHPYASPLMPKGETKIRNGMPHALSHTPSHKGTSEGSSYSLRLGPPCSPASPWVLPPAAETRFSEPPGKAPSHPVHEKERKIPPRQPHGEAGYDFSPPQMTQPSSLSGKLILQQPFKWPLHPQPLPPPINPPHAARFTFPAPLLFLSCSKPLLSPQDTGDRGIEKRVLLILTFKALDVRACPGAQ